MALAGFQNWKPNHESRVILDGVMQVFEDYKDYLPLTGRQIFYRLVGAYDYPKTEKAADRLYKILGRARRAAMIPFGHMRDGGGQKQEPMTFDDEAAFWRSVWGDFDHYSRDRQTGQTVYVELFCEAPGMLPQLTRAAFPYSVAVHGTRGYAGLSVIGEIARRALMRDYPTMVLQVGDLDPSGIGIFDTMSADAHAFVFGAVQAMTSGRDEEGVLAKRLGTTKLQTERIVKGYASPEVNFERIALTWEQVEEYDLPTAPPSLKDTRSKYWPYDDTAQAEALPPDVLQQVVRDAIEEKFDMPIYRAEMDQESEDRLAIMDRLPDREDE